MQERKSPRMTSVMAVLSLELRTIAQRRELQLTIAFTIITTYCTIS